MAYSYTRASNLRSIMQKAGCPEAIRNCEAAFRKLVSANNHNSLETVIQALPSLFFPEETGVQVPPIPEGRVARAIPCDLLVALQSAGLKVPSIGYQLSNITLHGSTFSVGSKHSGNSYVMIKSQANHHIPARIDHIIQFENQSLYLAVRRFKRAGLYYDPYARYKSLGARIWSDQCGELEVVTLDNVACHFACLPLTMSSGAGGICVLPLWRRVQVGSCR